MTDIECKKYRAATIRVDYEIYRPETLAGFFVTLHDDDGKVEHGAFPTLEDAERFAVFNTHDYTRNSFEHGLEQSVHNYITDSSNPDQNHEPALILNNFYPHLSVPAFQRLHSDDFISREVLSVCGASYEKFIARSNISGLPTLFDHFPIAHSDFVIAEPNSKTEPFIAKAIQGERTYVPIFEAISDPEKIVLIRVIAPSRDPAEPFVVFSVFGWEITAIVLDKKNIAANLNAVPKIFADAHQTPTSN